MTDQDKPDEAKGEVFSLIHKDGAPVYLDSIPKCRGDGHTTICRKCLKKRGDDVVGVEFGTETDKKKRCTKCQTQRPLTEFKVNPGGPCQLAKLGKCDVSKQRQRCEMEVQYFDNFFKPILAIWDKFSPFEQQQILTKLYPLEQQLVTLRKQEMLVGNNVIYSTAKGGFAVHPVYGEIRAIIEKEEKFITWLGLRGKLGVPAMKPAKGDRTVHPRGKPGHSEEISK